MVQRKVRHAVQNEFYHLFYTGDFFKALIFLLFWSHRSDLTHRRVTEIFSQHKPIHTVYNKWPKCGCIFLDH